MHQFLEPQVLAAIVAALFGGNVIPKFIVWIYEKTTKRIAHQRSEVERLRFENTKLINQVHQLERDMRTIVDKLTTRIAAFREALHEARLAAVDHGVKRSELPDDPD